MATNEQIQAAMNALADEIPNGHLLMGLKDLESFILTAADHCRNMKKEIEILKNCTRDLNLHCDNCNWKWAQRMEPGESILQLYKCPVCKKISGKVS